MNNGAWTHVNKMYFLFYGIFFFFFDATNNEQTLVKCKTMDCRKKELLIQKHVQI